MKFLSTRALPLAACLFSCTLTAKTVPANEQFKHWIDIQHVLHDRNITALIDSLDDGYAARFKKNYEAALPIVRELWPLLSQITAGAINEQGHVLKAPLSDDFKAKLTQFFTWMDQNPAAFVAYLAQNNFQDNPQRGPAATLETYKAFIKLLLSTKTPRQEEEYSIALANRLVEFCYTPATFLLYHTTMRQAEYHPIGRLLNGIIWYNIIGNGWKLWHADCLQRLQTAARSGKRIHYIAGGNDVYMLLSNEVYNITVVDPFLPSQVQFYAPGWEFLLSGAIDDEIVGMFGGRELRLVRTQQRERGSFLAKTGQRVATLPQIVTTWTVLDAQTDESLGTLVFDRRHAQQRDVEHDETRELLMSYDEFIYLCNPEVLDGWGIKIAQLPADFTCHIKQLRNPTNRDFLNNLHVAAISNDVDLKFINLASNPN